MRKLFFLIITIVAFICDAAYIDEKILQDLKTQTRVPILVHFQEKVNLKQFYNTDRKQRGWILMDQLQQVAKKSQASVQQFLKTKNIQFTSFWISNVISIDYATNETIFELSRFQEVSKIVAAFGYKVDLPRISHSPSKSSPIEEWNVRWINSHKLYEKGFHGEGMVVGGADTGIDYTHEALIRNYRGFESKTHDYHWWDGVKVPYFTEKNPCGYNSTKPCDDDSHGTHTIGTMVGDAPNRKIGVAPKAKWIGCRMMESGFARPATILSCLQFFLAPTDLGGNNPNPDLRPHATGHSYGCARQRCPDFEAVRDAVEALRAAGIFVVVAAGNNGPICGSIGDGGPPAHYNASFTVGATGYQTDNITLFSSRGPVMVDRSQRRKPDVTAPGFNVTSCVPGGRYASYSGTSMAAPAVTGAIALLYSAVPALERDVDLTQIVLQKTANHQRATPPACDSERETPNNVFGYGTINLEKAYEAAIKLVKH